MTLSYNLQDLYLFSVLAESGGFTETARLLGMPKSRVSRRLAKLEAELDTRLVQRTTRAFALTSAGEELCRTAHIIAQHARDIQSSARNMTETVGGSVRIGLPVSIEQLVFPHIVSHFTEHHPELSFDLITVSDPAKMIASNIDLMLIRHGNGIVQESFIRSKICEVSWIVCTTPEQSGEPSETDGGSQGGGFYLYRGLSDRVETSLCQSDTIRTLMDASSLVWVNDILGIRKLVLRGLGAGLLPRFLVRSELEEGMLVEVDASFPAFPDPIFAVYPSREQLPRNIRLVIDCLRRQLPIHLAH